MNYQDIANQLRKIEPGDGSYCRLVPGEKMDVILSALDLASAAGDMLVSLKALQRTMNHDSCDDEVCVAARAVVAKADGRHCDASANG